MNLRPFLCTGCTVGKGNCNSDISAIHGGRMSRAHGRAEVTQSIQFGVSSALVILAQAGIQSNIYRLKGGLYLSVRSWFYHSIGFALNGEATAPSHPCDHSISTSMYKTFFACPKNEVPKVAPVHPCTCDIRASCTSKKDTPDIKAPRKDLGLPSSVSSAHGVAPT